MGQAIAVEIEDALVQAVRLYRLVLVGFLDQGDAVVPYQVPPAVRTVAPRIPRELALAVAERLKAFAGMTAESRRNGGDEGHVRSHSDAVRHLLLCVVEGERKYAGIMSRARKQAVGRFFAGTSIVQTASAPEIPPTGRNFPWHLSAANAKITGVSSE